MGLSSDTSPDFIDYSLDLRDVIINVAKNALRAHERGDWSALDFLSYIQHDIDEPCLQSALNQGSGADGISLPSWVPNFYHFALGKTFTFTPIAQLCPSYDKPLPLDFDLSFGEDEVNHLRPKVTF